jgi:hypothetical protein
MIPSICPDGYNSNSYISGLLDAANIQKPPLIDSAIPPSFPGWDKPVPKEKFQ